MKKNRGQSLVEFIIILPILLLILLSMVDFGNIIYKKYALESSLDTVVELYKNNEQKKKKKYLSTEEAKVQYEQDADFVKIVLTKDIKILTPGLNVILKDPYEIKVERTIYYE